MTTWNDLIIQIECRNTRRITDDLRRMCEIILIVTAKLCEREYCSQCTTAAACTACALLLVCDGRGHIAHSYAQKATNVNTHFHRGCDGKHIYAVIIRVLVIMQQVLEPSLLIPRLYSRDLRSMLRRSQRIGVIKP